MPVSRSATPTDRQFRKGDRALAALLRREIEGEALFDPFSRGRYATDASIYQIEPIGVVVPAGEQDVVRTLQIAAEHRIPVTARGAGTSQCGQTVNDALVIDTSRHLDGLVEIDPEAMTATVQPGTVLDHLNQALKPHGLWFPVDVSTGSRATIGGMAGNNSCGARSIKYGTMRDNVLAIDALMADGEAMRFEATGTGLESSNLPSRQRDLVAEMLDLGRREAAEIEARFPKVLRRVGGYNLDALVADGDMPNLAHLLVGSEGTLAFFRRITLKLSPLPRNKVLGVCQFPTFHQAMDATRHLVALRPTAVELIDRTMIDLAREIPMFRPTVERFVKGNPGALLMVEFAEDDQDENLRRLRQLDEAMGDLGFPGAVVEGVDPEFQAAISEVRKSGLNIIMSMKAEGKPVSFVEDCAVELGDLAEYTARLTEIFEKHGTQGTWYAHASVGCLHVRPVLNLKLDEDVRKMRAIAEEAFEMVRGYRGSHSGEHGDGIVRSEFHEAMFGSRMVGAFEAVKDAFDPDGRLNPGRIVRPPRMDDRRLFRYPPDYRVAPMETALDWSDWGGFGGAVEMCNNNGACRKFDANVMCPSFRVTRDERHVVRGRANTLRLAISGQLGPDALTSPEMAESMALCVGCKGCRRECPTGVDMARMKIEVLHQRVRKGGLGLRDRVIGYLPRYAPLLAKAGSLANLRDRVPGMPWLSEKLLGLAARQPLPRWSQSPFAPEQEAFGPPDGPELVLLADTFNRYFEPENLVAALTVLTAAGYRVHVPKPADGGSRPLCCGRTFLSVGLVDEARHEARRSLEALRPFVERGAAVVGLEPSCLLTWRDEFKAMLPGAETDRAAARAMLLEEFLAAEAAAGNLSLPLKPLVHKRALLHGHCHQKAFGAVAAVETVLRLIPGLEVETVASTCCGMAGAFGYAAETHEIARDMAELSLLPAIRAADADTLIVADGTSCRHRIDSATARQARHVALVLRDALAAIGW